MKIKILEAMAFGVPVVTTSEGVEGLPAVDGEHAGVCEDDAGPDRPDRRPAERLRERQNRQRLAARGCWSRTAAQGRTVDAIEAIYDRMPSGTTR